MGLRQSDRAEFGEILTRTSELYGARMQPNLLELWWQVLADYDMAAIRHALTLHLRNPDTGQFMPKPADVIRMLGGTTQDAAQIAWSKVYGAVRKVGGWMDVVFDDPTIHCVLSDMGGWTLLCGTNEDQMPFKAREFETRYRGYARVQQRPASVPRLTGRINTENAAKGLLEALEPPMMVGDPAKCEEVLQLGFGASGSQITQGGKVAADVVTLKRLK